MRCALSFKIAAGCAVGVFCIIISLYLESEKMTQCTMWDSKDIVN